MNTLVFHKIKSVPKGRISSIFFLKIIKIKRKFGGTFVGGSVYCLQNRTVMMPQKEGGCIVPYRDTSRALHDRCESIKLDHQIWIGDCGT